MPLPLTFGKPPAGVKKLLDSISEEDEDDSDSTISSASPKAKSIDYSARPKSSNSNMYPSKTNDDSSRKSEQRSANLINNALSVATPSGTISHDTHTIEISELKMSIKQLTEAHKHQQSTTEGTCNAILEHMLSSKEELLVLHNDVKQLLRKRGGESSQPLDMLNETLRALTNEMKSSNDEHREAILTLKLSAENERKALQAQLSNERLISSNLRNELEKEMECRTMEKKELEMEKAGDKLLLFDKLARQWKQLERSEALFEQRKLAASEDIENAEKMMSMIRAAEAKLNSEMERLVHLSDYVREKDIKAQEQIEHARELTNKLLEIDVSRDEFFENAEKNQQEMSESRMIIARERVAMLKERARERERCLVGGSIGKQQ